MANLKAHNKLKKAQEIINTSGNILHLRIADYLRKRGRGVEISTYYTDFQTNASREIDIIAWKILDMKAERFEDFMRRKKIGIRLFIECKYINKEEVVVFRTQEKDIEFIKEFLVSQKIISQVLDGKKVLPDDINSAHRYLNNQGTIAKLFDGRKGEEKKNSNENGFFKSINQVLHSCIYFEDKVAGESKDVTCWIDYPIIVVNDFNNFFEKIESEKVPKPIGENFLFGTNYAYKKDEKVARNRYFMIDIVAESNLDALVDSLESELEMYKTYWDQHVVSYGNPIFTVDYSSML